VTGALAFAFIGTKTLGAIVVVCILYGIFSGGLVSLVPLLIVAQFPDRAILGNRLGMATAVVSLGLLVGTPISGHLLDVHGFKAAWAWAGVSGMVGAFTLAVSRGLFGGWVIMKRL
jgi:MFS family permease